MKYTSPNVCAGIILCMRPANKRRRYNVTASLIGWAHAQNFPCNVEDILCGIANGTFEIPLKISIHWKVRIIYTVNLLRPSDAYMRR